MDGEEQSEAGKKSGRDGHPVRVVVQSLGHPLMLLFIGSLLTYIVAPIVVDGINSRKLRQEAKQKKAQEVWRYNTEFNSKLNALKTMLESYHSQNLRLQLAPADLLEAQKEFRRDFNRRYLELDEMAWWWYSDLEREMRTLDLTPKDKLPKINADLERYGKNVLDSIGQLRPLWRILTSHDYQPGEVNPQEKLDCLKLDPEKKPTAKEFDCLKEKAGKKLSELFKERSEIVTDVTEIITTPQ